jgi:hypothetical protein
MIEQVSNPVKFVAFFTANKTGATGLTVTADVYSPSGTQIVTAASATAIGGGLYGYTLSTNNSSEGEYAAIFKTTDSTVDAQHIPSLWVLGRAGVENLDSTVSSRLSPSGTLATVTNLTNAPSVPSASAIATAVWAAADKTGYSLTSAERTAIATAVESSILNESDGQQILNAIVGAIGNQNVDQIALVAAIRSDLERNGGKLINLDATVSSRLASSAYTAPTSAPTAASVASAVRTELGTELGRMDAAVSSRLATAGYTAPTTPPTAVQNATAVRAELATELGRVDATISSRATAANIPTSDITAIKGKTDLLNTDRLAQVSTVSTTGAQLAAALS